MAEFDYQPLDPDPDPAPLSPSIPLNPPMVGEASPFEHVDGQNRDLILESIRTWIRTRLLAWTRAWQEYLVYWLKLVEDWLNGFIVDATAYIKEHAVAGYSWRTTATPIAETGTTTVTIASADLHLRPLTVNDLVSDRTDSKRYGIVVSVVDSTHAVVQPLGILSGLPGHGWWATTTPINATGPTDVTIPTDPTRPVQVGDFVSDQSSALRFGQITALIDPNTATVTPLGALRGLAGFGWWTTTTDLAGSGTTAVVLQSGPDRKPQVNDLVVDDSDLSRYGEIVSVQDDANVTVAYVGRLRGPAGVAELGSFDFTTSELNPLTVYQGQMVQPQMVGAFRVVTTSRAWVRVYASESYMLADADRSPLTPLAISEDHGCYLDFLSTPDELVKTLTPGVQITDLGDGVWISIRNMDVNNPQSIEVKFDYRIFRQ